MYPLPPITTVRRNRQQTATNSVTRPNDRQNARRRRKEAKTVRRA